ncbi:hypothetical protein MTAT_19690 [Moorella thermoacetica]|uniref:Uncharacterized protein n=1 Tax=Neomoorella thermoacetica TaxID=1525 RepID=A0AAC9HIT9_NEOTH|nr:hypothetical protein Maut_02196 [Moorella thermoacetica]TYL12727.1 hypothetical protein MTAT_19690 [Moorella thermoacetica]
MRLILTLIIACAMCFLGVFLEKSGVTESLVYFWLGAVTVVLMSLANMVEVPK